MKNLFALFAILLVVLVSGCKSDDPSEPCSGNGIITFNNKTDSSVVVQLIEAHNTFTVLKDYIKVITVKGNQSYTIGIEGRNLNKDTSLSIHNCETKNFTILR